MACIVTGFPSSIAALQFEWAWQNAHLTRRIDDESRISAAATRKKVNSSTGKVRQRKVRPSMSLADRLGNLHLLLRAPSFARWPLELRFFSQDVHSAWVKSCADLEDDDLSSGDSKVSVVLDLATPTSVSGGSETAGGLADVDATYAPLKDHVDKSSFLLAEGERVSCAVCRAEVNNRQTTLVCSNPGCRSASHMACLSAHFLRTEASSEIVPKNGTCPSCFSDLKWVDLVREMTLRTRAEKDLAKLLKKPRTRKKATTIKSSSTTGAAAAAAAAAAVLAEGLAEDSADDGAESEGDSADGSLDGRDVVDEPLRHEADDDDDDDVMSVTSVGSIRSEPGVLSQRAARLVGARLDDVVEDSEWEGVEVLD